VHLKNTTSAPQKYVLQLRYAGGAYAPGLKELAPGETLTIDIAQLRADRVPDAFGRLIPADATEGQVHWSSKGREAQGIIGRAEFSDLDHGVSASYACSNCCPDHPYASWADPGYPSIDLNQTIDLHVVLQDEDCYNTVLEPYDLSWSGLDWYLMDSGVASGDGYYQTLTGQSEGSTTFVADWNESAFWNFIDMSDYHYCEPEYSPIHYEVPVQVQARPNISGPNVVWYFGGHSPSGYATSITLTSSGGSGTQWSITAGSNKIQLSSSSGSSVDVTSTGSAFSSSAGDIQITATANGQTSSPFSLTSRKPFRLLAGSLSTTCPSSAWGYETFINYTIQDQLLANLPTAVIFNEHWSGSVVDDYSGTNWRRGAEGSFTSVSFSDWIGGENPALPPSPSISCGNTTNVQHWGQEWWVGNSTSGTGVKVQSNTLQKRRGSAIHLNIQ